MATIMHDAIEEAREAYQRDGAAVLRGVVGPEWIERIGCATDWIMSGRRGHDINRPDDGRFFAGFFSWLMDGDYRSFIHESGLAEIAGKIMRAGEVRFFYDQILVKEPGSAKRTPWHQDLPYWPVKGDDILSIWVPMDAATPENGVVTYVRGSHRWNAFFPSESWVEDGESRHGSGSGGAEQGGFATLADIRDHPERYDFLTWNVEPGDVLLHHPLTVHGAPGNLSNGHRRRAVATRWLGDDVRWHGSRENFMRRMYKADPTFPYPDLADGDPMRAEIFPLIWQG
jgi:ectoine hydroxylase-related dioxygenase (phytanoyl-CoA dioxygenase family)